MRSVRHDRRAGPLRPGAGHGTDRQRPEQAENAQCPPETIAHTAPATTFNRTVVSAPTWPSS